MTGTPTTRMMTRSRFRAAANLPQPAQPANNREEAQVRPRLPPEIVDIILFDLLELVSFDPAYVWTHLRHVSSRLKQHIEHQFQEKWLPLMSVTLYADGKRRTDYEFEKLKTDNLDIAVLRNKFVGNAHHNRYGKSSSDVLKPHILVRALEKQSFQNPVTGVRLGSRVMINNTPLPGLSWEEDGSCIYFRWKEAMTALLQEEMYMRKVTHEIVSEEKAKYFRAHPDKAGTGITMAQDIALLVTKVQMQRRAAVLRHRFKRFDPSGATQPTFRLRSRYLHKQKLSEDEEAYRLRFEQAYHDGLVEGRRKDGPDIFEQVHVEEVMSPSLEYYQQRLWDEGKQHRIPDEILTAQAWWARQRWLKRGSHIPHVEGSDPEDNDSDDGDDGDDSDSDSDDTNSDDGSIVNDTGNPDFAYVDDEKDTAWYHAVLPEPKPPPRAVSSMLLGGTAPVLQRWQASSAYNYWFIPQGYGFLDEYKRCRPLIRAVYGKEKESVGYLQ